MKSEAFNEGELAVWTDPEAETKIGVIKTEATPRNYIVTVRWKDDKTTERHFPAAGLEIVDPETQEELEKLKGQEIIEILKEHAAEYTSDEFSWTTAYRFVKEIRNRNKASDNSQAVDQKEA